MSALTTLKHGGDLHNAIAMYGGSLSDWIDLSTGISPWVYPIPPLAANIWQRLPYMNASLRQAALSYYGGAEAQLCLTPGSQLAIRLIPMLIKQPGCVAVPDIGYQEHAHSWRSAGHKLVVYDDQRALLKLAESGGVDHVVIINPNNPTGEQFSPTVLVSIASKLSGILVVDEAFVDLDNCLSLLNNPLPPSVIVLRSLGKFFGLAGARIGFTFSKHPVIHRLEQTLQPWSISGPTLRVAEQALRDVDWQALQKQRIRQQASTIDQFMIDYTLQFEDIYHTSTGLFTTLFGKRRTIQTLHTKLAEQHIWSRLGVYESNVKHTDGKEQPHNWLRLSLPGDKLDKLLGVLGNTTTV